VLVERAFELNEAWVSPSLDCELARRFDDKAKGDCANGSGLLGDVKVSVKDGDVLLSSSPSGRALAAVRTLRRGKPEVAPAASHQPGES